MVKVLKGYRIEPLDARHIESIVAIEKLTNPSPWSERSFRNELREPQSIFKTILFGDVVVGFGGIWLVVDEAHLTTIAVHPDHQGKGLGKLLLKVLLEEAVDKGMVCATLEVRANNDKAIHLYESFGFRKCGIRKKYYPVDGQDALVMWVYDLNSRPWNI